MTALLDLLTKFSESHGTSGYEDQVRALFIKEAKKLVDTIEVTPLGSVIATKRATTTRRNARANVPTPRILIEAHMDEIGFLVTDLQEGFIRFDQVGYFDPRVLPSQDVIVHGRKPLRGVIGSRPPHVLTAEDRKKTLALDELFIDVGMSEERVRELVSIGDFITIDRRVASLQNGAVTGKAFDDRSSLVALLEMLRQLQDVEHVWDVVAVANVNEEDSGVYVGALTSTYAVQPQLALCLDVTFAQEHGMRSDELSELGLGPCIARGANIHPVVFEKLRQAAARESLPHQITVYGDSTQTNAWVIQVTAAGIPTGLVEIPLRYMHTSVETINLADVAHTAELLRLFVAGLTLEDYLALQGESYSRDGKSAHNGRNGNHHAESNGHTPRPVTKPSRTKSARRPIPKRRVVTRRPALRSRSRARGKR